MHYQEFITRPINICGGLIFWPDFRLRRIRPETLSQWALVTEVSGREGKRRRP